MLSKRVIGSFVQVACTRRALSVTPCCLQKDSNLGKGFEKLGKDGKGFEKLGKDGMPANQKEDHQEGMLKRAIDKMSTMKKKAEDEYDPRHPVKSTMKVTKDTVKDVAQEAKDAVKTAYETVKDTVTGTAGSAKEKVGDAVHSAKGTMKSGAHKVKSMTSDTGKGQSGSLDHDATLASPGAKTAASSIGKKIPYPTAGNLEYDPTEDSDRYDKHWATEAGYVDTNKMKEDFKKPGKNLKEGFKMAMEDAKDETMHKGHDWKEKIVDKAHDLREGMKDKWESTKELANETKDESMHKGHDWKEKIVDKAHDLREGMKDKWESTKEVAKEAKDKVKEGMQTAKESTYGAAHETSNKMKEGMNTAKESMQGAAHETSNKMKEGMESAKGMKDAASDRISETLERGEEVSKRVKDMYGGTEEDTKGGSGFNRLTPDQAKEMLNRDKDPSEGSNKEWPKAKSRLDEIYEDAPPKKASSDAMQLEEHPTNEDKETLETMVKRMDNESGKEGEGSSKVR